MLACKGAKREAKGVLRYFNKIVMHERGANAEDVENKGLRFRNLVSLFS